MTKSEYISCSQSLSDEKQKIKNRTKEILDSLAIRISLLNTQTNAGNARLPIIQNIIEEFPYVKGYPTFNTNANLILEDKPSILITHLPLAGASVPLVPSERIKNNHERDARTSKKGKVAKNDILTFDNYESKK